MSKIKDRVQDLSVKAYIIGHEGVDRLKHLPARAHQDMVSGKRAQGILEYGIILVVVVGLAVIVKSLKDTVGSKLQEASKMVQGVKS